MGAALPYNGFHNGCTTTATRAVFTVERAQAILETAARAIHAFEHHIDARSPNSNRARQHALNRTIQPAAFGARECLGGAQGMQACVPQRFVHVNITQPSQECLIEQQWL